MHYAIICVDKRDSMELRMATRPAHVAYLDNYRDQMVAAGPTLTDDGEGMTGSIIIMDFDDRAAAEAFAAGDPYAQAGLFESVTITAWRKVFPPDSQ